MKVAINGFGRIGRIFFRAAYKKLNIVAINNPSNAETLAHLLKYDSVYGRFPGKVEHTKDSLIVDGKKIKLTFENDIEKLPWKELGIDVVVESTGVFRYRKDLEKHLKAGAKKVILTAPPKDNTDATIIVGVNDKNLKATHKVIDAASCTTNCFIPVLKILDDNFGISKGFMVTTHAYTGDQRILDGSHDDLRRARTACLNIVPTSSGAAKSVESIFPKFKGKIHSSAMRVPVACGSVIYFTCDVKKKASIEKVNEAFKKASIGSMKNVIEYTKDPIVSSDVIGNSHSAVFDSLLTEVDEDLVKVVAWYDNEYGYSCRLIDIIKQIKL